MENMSLSLDLRFTKSNEWVIDHLFSVAFTKVLLTKVRKIKVRLNNVVTLKKLTSEGMLEDLNKAIWFRLFLLLFLPSVLFYSLQPQLPL